MKFSTFVLVFVAALYNETQNRQKTEFTVGEIMDRYGLAFQPGWMDNFFRDTTLDTYLEARRHLGPVRQQRVSLSAEGLRWVEDELGDNVVTFLEQHGAHYSTDDEEALSDGLVDSSRWTGRTLSTSEKAELLINLSEALRRVDNLNLSQEKRAQARAFLRAAQELADAPEPPFDLIQLLLKHVDRIIGVAGLFIGIAGLLVAA